MEEEKTNKTWTKLLLSGRLMVSDFTRVHCTDDFSSEFNREDLKPGDALPTPYNYSSVKIKEFDGEDVILLIDGKERRATPYKSATGPDYPLDYAWSNVYVGLA